MRARDQSDGGEAAPPGGRGARLASPLLLRPTFAGLRHQETFSRASYRSSGAPRAPRPSPPAPSQSEAPK